MSNAASEDERAERPAAPRREREAARSRRRMARPSRSSSRGCATTFWPGGFAPGSRFVEGDLTARFAVSRGPVREALRRLAADGLIEHWPHRGALVRRLSVREIRELFEIRIEMEALAARLAAAADALDRRARFVAAIEPIYADAPRNPCEYLKENAAFHDAVMALADNLAAARSGDEAAIAAHHGPGRRRADAAGARGLGAGASRHRQGDLERDPEAASARMREHLERAAALALARRACRREAPSAAGRGRRSAALP